MDIPSTPKATPTLPATYHLTTPTIPSDFTASEQSIDLEILDRRMRRLAQKLKKHDVHLEVFEHSDIAYGPMLGKGGEGIVYRCTVKYQGIPIDAAVKKIVNSSEDAISMTLDEVELLCLARDPIVACTLQVYGVAAVPSEPGSGVGHLVILTEVGQMNALQLYQQEPVPTHVTLALCSRLAAGVACLHRRHIIHHDLKPENVLITAIDRDGLGQIQHLDFRIIDLGMAKRVFTEKVSCEEILGTNGYHAPEVLLDEDYDFRADVFMLGVTFCVLMHAPCFLKSQCLPNLLLQLHEAKHRLLAGAALLRAVLLPSMASPPPLAVRDMLGRMLEQQQRRTIGLAEIAEICRCEAEAARLHFSLAALALPPSDSGLSSPASSPFSPALKIKRRRRTVRTRGTRRKSTLSGLVITPRTRCALRERKCRLQLSPRQKPASALQTSAKETVNCCKGKGNQEVNETSDEEEEETSEEEMSDAEDETPLKRRLRHRQRKQYEESEDEATPTKRRVRSRSAHEEEETKRTPLKRRLRNCKAKESESEEEEPSTSSRNSSRHQGDLDKESGTPLKRRLRRKAYR